MARSGKQITSSVLLAFSHPPPNLFHPPLSSTPLEAVSLEDFFLPANLVNLKFEEALPEIQKGLCRSISGLF